MKSVNILLKTLLLSSPLVLSTTIFGAIIVQEDFNSYSLGDIGNQGDWQLFRDNTGPGTADVALTGTTFGVDDNPFGDVVGNTLQVSVGNDATLMFAPRAGGTSTYFSYNYLALDSNAGNHTVTFWNSDPTLTPYTRITSTGDASVGQAKEITINSNSGTDSGSDVFTQDVGYFIYGKIETSADLRTFTISVNVTDNVLTIPTGESWTYQATFTYGTARATNVEAMTFDTDGDPGRFLIDNIRIGETYADVTAVPEPSTYALLAGFATLGLVMFRRRQRL
jgi:hypothetical protein